jgi:hypothetical protein
MHRIAIADESGTHSGNLCYGIGAFVMPAETQLWLERRLRFLLSKYSIGSELKWSDTPSRTHIEAAVEAVGTLLRHASYYAIVVEKGTFRNYQKNREEAFYQTYHLLASHIAKASDDPFELFIDERSDSYPRRTEVVHKITNYVTTRRQSPAHLIDVRMIDSKSSAILQMTDMLTGAITADTNRWLAKDKVSPSFAKGELIRRFAALLGWDRLCYDTMPDPTLNIWHFPTEFRARPKTLAVRRNPSRLTA